MGLAVDIEAGYVFWSDISQLKRGIYRANYVDGGNLTDVTRLTDGEYWHIFGSTTKPVIYDHCFGCHLSYKATLQSLSFI